MLVPFHLQHDPENGEVDYDDTWDVDDADEDAFYREEEPIEEPEEDGEGYDDLDAAA